MANDDTAIFMQIRFDEEAIEVLKILSILTYRLLILPLALSQLFSKLLIFRL